MKGVEETHAEKETLGTKRRRKMKSLKETHILVKQILGVKEPLSVVRKCYAQSENWQPRGVFVRQSNFQFRLESKER